jgi:hypothetical protein
MLKYRYIFLYIFLVNVALSQKIDTVITIWTDTTGVSYRDTILVDTTNYHLYGPFNSAKPATNSFLYLTPAYPNRNTPLWENSIYNWQGDYWPYQSSPPYYNGHNLYADSIMTEYYNQIIGTLPDNFLSSSYWVGVPKINKLRAERSGSSTSLRNYSYSFFPYYKFPLYRNSDTIGIRLPELFFTKGINDSSVFIDARLDSNTLTMVRRWHKHTNGLLTDTLGLDTITVIFTDSNTVINYYYPNTTIYGDTTIYGKVRTTGLIPIRVDTGIGDIKDTVKLNYKYPLYVDNDTLTTAWPPNDTTTRIPTNICLDVPYSSGRIYNNGDETGGGFYPRNSGNYNNYGTFLVDKPYNKITLTTTLPKARKSLEDYPGYTINDIPPDGKIYLVVAFISPLTGGVLELIQHPISVPSQWWELYSPIQYTQIIESIDITTNYTGQYWTKPFLLISKLECSTYTIPIGTNYFLPADVSYANVSQKYIDMPGGTFTYCYDSTGYINIPGSVTSGMEIHGMRGQWHNDFGINDTVYASKIRKISNKLEVTTRTQGYDKGMLYSQVRVDTFLVANPDSLSKRIDTLIILTTDTLRNRIDTIHSYVYDTLYSFIYDTLYFKLYNHTHRLVDIEDEGVNDGDFIGWNAANNRWESRPWVQPDTTDIYVDSIYTSRSDTGILIKLFRKDSTPLQTIIDPYPTVCDTCDKYVLHTSSAGNKYWDRLPGNQIIVVSDTVTTDTILTTNCNEIEYKPIEIENSVFGKSWYYYYPCASWNTLQPIYNYKTIRYQIYGQMKCTNKFPAFARNGITEFYIYDTQKCEISFAYVNTFSIESTWKSIDEVITIPQSIRDSARLYPTRYRYNMPRRGAQFSDNDNQKCDLQNNLGCEDWATKDQLIIECKVVDSLIERVTSPTYGYPTALTATKVDSLVTINMNRYGLEPLSTSFIDSRGSGGTLDTGIIVMPWELGAYQSKGTYLVPTDSGNIRTFSNLLYEYKGISVVKSDSNTYYYKPWKINNLLDTKISFPGFGTSHSTAAYGDHSHGYDYWSDFSHPNTLAGYGITDAASSSHNHTGVYQPVGSYVTGTPWTGMGYLTSETDPTIYAWAKASIKPTYTYSEVDAAPSSTVSFPGFGTSHSTAAYGDHSHSGVYEPLLSTGTTGWIPDYDGNGKLRSSNSSLYTAQNLHANTIEATSGFTAPGGIPGADGILYMTYVTAVTPNLTSSTIYYMDRYDVEQSATFLTNVTLSVTTHTTGITIHSGLVTSSSYTAVDRPNEPVNLTLNEFEQLKNNSWQIDPEYLEFLEFKKWKSKRSEEIKSNMAIKENK